jgi:hypothetical protein
MMSTRARTIGRIALFASAIVLAASVVRVGLAAFGAEAAPASPLISSAPLRPTVSTRATFAFDRLPGMQYECAVRDAAFEACTSPIAFSGLRAGAHTFGVRARKPGGATSTPATYVWTIVPPRDGAVPVTSRVRPTLTTAPITPWISRNATFAWLSKASATTECRLDASRWRPCASPRTYAGLRLGRHVFAVRGRTAAGRRSTVNRFAWTISSSPPPPPPIITSHPDDSTTATDASFGFALAGGAAGECRLDDGAWVDCSSAAMYVGLGSGAHVFCVRAVNAVGVASSETCVAWTIEAAPSEPEPSGPFTLSGDLPGALSPGASAPLPIRVSNPFPFPIRVTALTVTVRPASSHVGCDAPSNLAITQSNTAGGAISIVVPAHGAVTLPAQGATAPTVTMLDLATDQEACKGAVFTADYAGTGVQQ